MAEWYIAVIRKAVRTLKQAFFATAIHVSLQMKGEVHRLLGTDHADDL